MKVVFKIKLIFLLVVQTFLIQNFANAEIDIKKFISDTLKHNNEIINLKKQTVESELDIKEAYTVYYPEVSLSAETGNERKFNSTSPSKKAFSSYSVSIDQTIYDSGKNIQNIAIAKTNYEIQKLNEKNKVNEFIIRAAETYLNVIKSYEKLVIANEAETNTRIISGQEEIRISAGSGLASDDLNAKRELASAQKKVILANKQYNNSVNRFKEIYKIEDIKYSDLKRPELKNALMESLPKSEEKAIEIGLKNNLELKITSLESDISQKKLLVSLAEFGPSISAKLNKKYKDDVSFTQGSHNEENASITVTLPISNLFSKQPSYKKSKSVSSRSLNQHILKREEIRRKIKIAWQEYFNSGILLKYSENEALIAEELLSIATKERKLNKINARSLLSSEESYRIALGDLSSSRIDLLLSVYKLTNVIGLFNSDTI